MARRRLSEQHATMSDNRAKDPVAEGSDKSHRPARLKSSIPGLQLLAASPDCVKLIDTAGRITYISENGCRLLDLDSADRIIGKDWAEQWPVASRSAVSLAIEKAERGEPARFSGECSTALGVMKWWDVAVSPVRDEAGQLLAILAISRDITQQYLTEQRLRASEARFQTLADNISQLAWMADGDGEIFWYNRRWFDYTGTTLDEVKGWGWRRVHHPDHIDRVAAKIAHHFKTGEVWEDTFPLRGADGTYRWFLSRAQPIKGADGRVSVWFGTNTDITAQRNASQRLRQKARLIDLSHEAILVWDVEQGIVLWNRGCEELYGYPQAEALGARTHELLNIRHPVPHEEFLARLRAQGGWSGELQHIAKDGSEVWIDSRQELVRIGGRELVLETNRDITERKKADEVRDILIGELNHRVKNTLAIVQSISSQTARSATSAEQFARSFNGRLQSLAAAHDVLTSTNWTGAVLHRLITSQVAPFADERTVSISGPELYVPAQSALQLSLILHELVANAAKFGSLSRPGGRVIVDWSIETGEAGESGRSRVHIIWREQGGPAVCTPQMRGFGLTLIERSASLPSVNARLAFEPSGVVCHVTTDLVDREKAPAMFSPALKRNLRTPGVGNAPRRQMPRAPRAAVVTTDTAVFDQVEDILANAGLVVVGPIASAAAALALASGSSIDVVVFEERMAPDFVTGLGATLTDRGVPWIAIAEPGQKADHDGFERVIKPIEAAALLAAIPSIVASQAQSA